MRESKMLIRKFHQFCFYKRSFFEFLFNCSKTKRLICISYLLDLIEDEYIFKHVLHFPGPDYMNQTIYSNFYEFIEEHLSINEKDSEKEDCYKRDLRTLKSRLKKLLIRLQKSFQIYEDR